MSFYDRCKYQTLCDLVNVRDIPTPDRKRATLVAALEQADTNDTMALQWTHIAEAALDETATARGIIFPQNTDLAGKRALLTAANLQPIDCIRAFIPAPAAQPAQPRLHLQRQLDTEPVLTFLDRAAMVLQAANITDAERTTQLLNAAQPALAEAIIQACRNVVPQPTFQEVIAGLTTNFAIQPSAAGAQFLQIRPNAGESYVDFGRRLQALYLQYLGVDRAAFQANSRWITPALIMRLISVVPAEARGHLQVAYDRDRVMEWSRFCMLADSFVPHKGAAKQPRTDQKHQQGLTSARSKPFCSKHGYGSHSTADCRALKADNNSSATPKPQQQPWAQQQQQRRQYGVNNLEEHPNEVPTLGQGVGLEDGY
jgi:hypothetical protein